MSIDKSIELTVNGCGVDLYDIVTLKCNDSLVYRVIISSKDGITLDKCSQVSKLLSPILDVNEPLNGKYNLEVSSAGVERKLLKPRHFKLSIDENIRVKSYKKDVILGVLKFADDEKITIETSDLKEQIVNYDDILAASTYYKWD